MLWVTRDLGCIRSTHCTFLRMSSQTLGACLVWDDVCWGAIFLTPTLQFLKRIRSRDVHDNLEAELSKSFMYFWHVCFMYSSRLFYYNLLLLGILYTNLKEI